VVFFGFSGLGLPREQSGILPNIQYIFLVDHDGNNATPNHSQRPELLPAMAHGEDAALQGVFHPEGTQAIAKGTFDIGLRCPQVPKSPDKSPTSGTLGFEPRSGRGGFCRRPYRGSGARAALCPGTGV